MATQYVYVALWQSGDFEPAGIIAYDKEVGISGFQYLNNYHGHPIDPINLNYQKTGTRMFKVDNAVNRQLLHRVFQDQLPGAWGMNMLMAENPALKSMTAAERLSWFGERTVGGLSCRVGGKIKGEHPNTGLHRLNEIKNESVALFTKRIASITDKKMWWGLTSHGGARPKTAYVDDQGDHWIAKFNVDFDGFNSARVEHALSVMAKSAGINAAETKVLTLPDGEDVFLTKRFDRTSALQGGQPVDIFRAHQVSLFAMMDEARIVSPDQADYTDMMRVVRAASTKPTEDGQRLFGQMLYNVAVNNTDDHARNFVMVLKDQGYELSPMFDVTPNIYAYPHASSICGQPNSNLDQASVLSLAGKMGINKDAAEAIRQDVTNAVMNWEEVAHVEGVSDADIALLKKRMYGAKYEDPDSKPIFKI